MVDEAKLLTLRFPGQKEGEQIKVLVRKHWVTDIKIGSIFLILGILPLILGIITASFTWDGSFDDPFLFTVLSFFIYLVFIFLITYIKWLNEELDVIIITNERVVAHDQVDLFHRQISETSISQIQDVKGVEKGMWGNLFHYGSLEIQTAARDITFRIKHVNRPYESARKILDLRDRYLDKEKFEEEYESESPVYNL